MEMGKSFVDFFPIVLISYILEFLDDPVDLIRFSAVSRSSRHFVIKNGVCKQLWLRRVPQITSIAFAVQENDGIIILSDFASESSVNWETLETEHKLYSSLLHCLAKHLISPKDIIAPLGIVAPSTDPYLEEIILNNVPPIHTRYMDNSPNRRVSSNCSTKAEITDPNALKTPENIMYKLKAGICIVTEVNLWLFKAYFEPVESSCSAMSVRFRMGHKKSIEDFEMLGYAVEQAIVDKYEWTYTSPVFPLIQEACMEQFKLREPVICVGGVFLVELFGRDQSDEGSFYARMACIKIVGQSLEPAYNLEMLPSGELQLNYYPHRIDFVLPSISLESAREVAAENGVVGGRDG